MHVHFEPYAGFKKKRGTIGFLGSHRVQGHLMSISTILDFLKMFCKFSKATNVVQSSPNVVQMIFR